jgi:hypothetical protein
VIIKIGRLLRVIQGLARNNIGSAVSDMPAVVIWLHTSPLSEWSTRAVLKEGRARRP